MNKEFVRKPVLHSIQVGLPKVMGNEGAEDPMDRPWESGIFKNRVTGPIWLGKVNLVGDGQADLKHHGGPDKAVLSYAAEHYAYWESTQSFPNLQSGGFGENFTVDGMSEADVCVGDTYRIGEAIIQVSQPRQPCWKLARRWKIPDLTLQVQENGFTGWYHRVLQEGYVEAGQPFELLERPFPQWTLAQCNEIMHHRRDDLQAAAELAALPLLAESWRITLRNRAEKGEQPDLNRRLYGVDE